MAKFKVGDKVRVKADLEVDKIYGTQSFVRSMKKYRGCVYTVDYIKSSMYGEYILEGTDCWTFTDEMLEPYEDDWFTTAQKAGKDYEAHKFEAFLREVADGYKRSTANVYHAYDCLYNIVNHDILDDKYYLTDEEFELSISDLVDFYVNEFVPDEDRPAVEMTLSEVEKALGHKVKIVEEELKPWE